MLSVPVLRKGLLAIAFLLPAPLIAEPAPDAGTLRAWIQEMKASPRGPFARIRWFCRDGTVLPPRPYACREHGGGSQHGEWSDRARKLRALGYYVANVLAALDLERALEDPGFEDLYNQILIEQFLITTDDGWILRRARYYRGALQEEAERRQARALLSALLERPRWLGRRYLRVRIGARLLRHGPETSTAARVRSLATDLAGRDPGFAPLRAKIHVHPGPEDAAAVRAYGARLSSRAPGVREDIETLARLIDEVYGGRSAVGALRSAAARLAPAHPGLARWLRDVADRLRMGTGAEERFLEAAAALAGIRERIPGAGDGGSRLELVDASLALESTLYAAGAELAGGAESGSASRAARLRWLGAGIEGAWGAGLLDGRQRRALAEMLARAREQSRGGAVALGLWKEVLDYLALVPGWGDAWMRFHFGRSVEKLARIEPLARLFPQDLLRSSPLFPFARLLDPLLVDANRLAGVRHVLLGREVGAGVRALNPGLARGRLLAALGEAPAALDRDGIYLLSETVAELPPVAGILTMGEGNPLSHVQLLARNLGIPNAAVDRTLVEEVLRPHVGERVLYGVSPGGAVRLAAWEPAWESLFGQDSDAPPALIVPDLEKLDLGRVQPVPLSRLRAVDSGRIVGPKAAKLGELRHHFPEAVADGVAIPFGAFRRLLETPLAAGSSRTLYQWMVGEYRRLEALPAGSEARREGMERLRARLHARIASTPVPGWLREALRASMARVFGPDGTYGVFVRSDTNVEDLPGFTGAGLNLTVPNVVGFDRIMEAIPRVWASPFTARAFAWRQAHMKGPEHVYPAVLLLRTVPVEKSGVMVTQDIDTGSRRWLSVAVNEGVGGAVDGQSAESLRIDLETGRVKLLAQATAPLRRVPDPRGGLRKEPVSDRERVLDPPEIEALVAFARELPRRFPLIVDDRGRAAPADVEFGFLGGALRLFQIRPFLESERSRESEWLRRLDAGRPDPGRIRVRLDRPPAVSGEEKR